MSRNDPAKASARDPLEGPARAAALGDRAAQRALLGAVVPAMSAAIRAMVPSADLDDVMQEALVGLVRALPAFRYECSVKHFACRIAVRTASVHNRTRSRRSRADDLGRPPVAEVAHGPDHDARARRRAGLFADLLASLPEPQSEAFALRVVLGYTLQEVAEATGAPANTVRSRVRLAKEALRERIATEPAFAELLEGTS